MPAKKQKKKPVKSVSIKDFIMHHLTASITIPVSILILIILLVTIKVDYQTVEKYTELENYEENVQETIQTPTTMNVCEDVPVEPEIFEHFKYGRPKGLNGYECYGEFRLQNNGPGTQEWIFAYEFDINGEKILVAEQKKEIPTLTSMTFEFVTQDCEDGDSISGEPVLISAPTERVCGDKEIMVNKTTIKAETRQREVPKERIVTLQESLWEKLLGVHK